MPDYYPWVQTSPGRWEQRCNFMEKLFAGFTRPPGQRVHGSVLSVAKFNYSGPPETNVEALLRDAWTTIRYKFPAIASHIDESKTGKIYQTPTPAELKSWLDETVNIYTTKTAAEFCSTATKERFVTLNYCVSSHELVLHAEHTHMDGRGTLYLWDTLFSALDQPTHNIVFGDEVKNLPIMMHDALGFPEAPSPESKQIAGQMGLLMANPSSITMPIPDVHLPPQDTLRRALALAPDLTAATLAACKARGISVTSAWHAAIALAIRRIQEIAGETPGDSFTAPAMFDLRPHFSSRLEPRTPGCYFTSIPTKVETGARPFAEISKELDDLYKGTLAPGSGKAAASPALIDMIAPHFANGPPPGTTPLLSSLGVLENFVQHSYGKWQLQDVYMAQVYLTAQIATMLWTWNGQMVLSGCANMAFYTEEDLDRFLVTTEQEMLRGLGIRGA